MGIIHKDHYDAFFSYAHDDDSLHDRWVHRFHEELEKKYGVLLRKKTSDCPILKNISGREPEFFIDNEGLPSNGGLTHELEEAIKKSEFLFVFVGTRYINSDWCGKEINFFFEHLKNQKKTETEIYERLFIIVLEKEAQQASWVKNTYLGKAKEEAIRLPFFDDSSGSPIRSTLRVSGKGELDTNPAMFDRLNNLAETMVKRTAQLIENAQLSAESQQKLLQPTNGITIGFIRPNLEEATDQLLKQLLKDNGEIKVEKLTEEDFASEDSDMIVMEKLRGSAIFVQPFDHGKVLMSYQEGGHLKLQEDIIKNKIKIPIVWWRVPSALGGIEAGSDQAETRESHAPYLATLDEKAQKDDVDGMVEYIFGIINPKRGWSRTTVYIESTKEDKDIAPLLQDELNKLWEKRFGSEAKIVWFPMPWKELSEDPDTFRTCGGVIIMYGNKSFKSLKNQIEELDKQLSEIRIKPGRTVAIIVPPREYNGPVGYYESFACEKTDKELKFINPEGVQKFLKQVFDKLSQSRSTVQ